MKDNVGGIDKLFRIVLSMALLGAGFYIPSWWGLLGLIPLFTALGSLCPVYSLFGISTCHANDCDS
ncbi:MAG: DUF2892 domain-containing protein [Gammaproteobacteria bacterium]|nr:DUF2892 domain-containing protein [Gammaproteobacteria bacterium]